MTITLNKSETTLLLEAAGRGGTLMIPDTTKPATRQRLIGRFERDGLIQTLENEHVLTPAGYRAVGLRQPRKARTKAGSDRNIPAGADAGPSRRGTKQGLILELLGRDDGATMAELIGATGWLPHTTRAALSRIRSAGQALAKNPRPDGPMAYRIERATSQAEAAEPKQTGSEAPTSPDRNSAAGRRSRRKAPAEGAPAGA